MGDSKVTEVWAKDLVDQIHALSEQLVTTKAAAQGVRYKVLDHTTKAVAPIVAQALDRIAATVALARQKAPDETIVAYLDRVDAHLKETYKLGTGAASGGPTKLQDDESAASLPTKKEAEPVGPLEWIDSFLLTGPRPAVATKATEPEPSFGDWLVPGLRRGN
jgi:hypothetical protein